MSTGQWMGAIVGAIYGAIIGLYVGGPWGALAGAVIGGAVGFAGGTYIDKMASDIPAAGAPAPMGMEVMSTEIGFPIPDLVGTGKVTGHLLCFGKERTEAQYTKSSGGGKGGGGSSSSQQVSGYKYYMSWAVGLIVGQTDVLYTIIKNTDDIVWEGELECPVSGGQETIVLEGMGSATFYFGTDDQVANATVGEIIGDATLNSPLRNMCWCFFDDCCIGEYNRTPSMKFLIKKTPVYGFSADQEIQNYDYNPMHALWHVLHTMSDLPESWLHSAEFAAAARTLKNEGKGISVLFATQQAALNYIESINLHVDNILRYGADGTLHPKLIREDYVVDDLLLIDESVLLEEPTLSRKSWIDTVNETKVQFSELVVDGGREKVISVNIYNLFSSGASNIVGVYFDGSSLTYIGRYIPLNGDPNGLVIRKGNLVTMGSWGASATLLKISATPVDGLLPLVSSNPLANQYDIGGAPILTIDTGGDRIFSMDWAHRLVRFDGLDRDARGFWSTVTTGTDGNLYVARYVYTSWKDYTRPITGSGWTTDWALVGDNVCDSPISVFGVGPCYAGSGSTRGIIYHEGYIYITNMATPKERLRKINPETLAIEGYVGINLPIQIAAAGDRIFYSTGIYSTTKVYAHSSIDLSVIGSTISVAGRSGIITVVGDYLILATSDYAGSGYGMYRINRHTMEVEEALASVTGQTLAAIGSTHVAVGSNNGLSVFSINPLALIDYLPISSSYGYSSQKTVVKDLLQY